MKQFIFLLAGLSLKLSAAPLLSPKDTFNSFKCKKSMDSYVQQWTGVGEWRGHVTTDGTMGLLKRTSKFAHWILADNMSESETLTLMTPQTATKITFGKDCKGEVTVYDHKQFSNPKGLDDTRLFKEMTDHPKGIVATWSPHMNLSVDAIIKMRKVAKEMNLPLLIAIDPFATKKEAETILEKRHVNDVDFLPLSSLELFYRDGTMHYPNFFVYKDGQILGHVRPGLMSEEEYKMNILTALEIKR